MLVSKKTRALIKRIFWVFVPAVLVLGGGVALLNFYLIHQLSHPPRTPLYSSPRDFHVIFEKPIWTDDKWKNLDGTESVGWFFSQGKPAPGIILTHSYGSNRSELLTLSFELWKAGYHILLYDMRGHGESPVKWSGLGTYEKEDLLSGIRYLKGLKNEAGKELFDGRIGLYGVGLGGYASLAASAQDPSVKAVAVDSVYPNVDTFVNHRLKLMVGSDSKWANDLVDWPWTGRMLELTMQLYLLRREDSDPATEALGAMTGRPALFMTGKDAGALEAMTRELYAQAKDPKQFVEVEQTRLDRLYDEKSANYDARVVEFFRTALPSGGDRKLVAQKK